MNSIQLSKLLGGKIEVRSKRKLTLKNLPILYTPGVAEVSRAVAKDRLDGMDATYRWRNYPPEQLVRHGRSP